MHQKSNFTASRTTVLSAKSRHGREDEKNSQNCAVVTWNQLQFTSVSKERIEEVFRAPKVLKDGENRGD